MSEYTPMEGDRVLLDGVGCEPGGEIAVVQVGTKADARPGELVFRFWGGGETAVGDPATLLKRWIRLELLHRPSPPRPPRPPDPEPFTRSDGLDVTWHRVEFGAWGLTTRTVSFTASEARRFAEGYERIAAILEWEEAYGD